MHTGFIESYFVSLYTHYSQNRSQPGGMFEDLYLFALSWVDSGKAWWFPALFHHHRVLSHSSVQSGTWLFEGRCIPKEEPLRPACPWRRRVIENLLGRVWVERRRGFFQEESELLWLPSQCIFFRSWRWETATTVPQCLRVLVLVWPPTPKPSDVHVPYRKSCTVCVEPLHLPPCVLNHLAITHSAWHGVNHRQPLYPVT